ncbi:MAG: ABC transporter permease subunit [Tenericutes bacterium]|jgi:sodium transport system permease protein|nr:ABC transporter permease subunit [Mycoplasmatota bacterium]
MKNIFVIFKKEIDRVLKDRRLILTLFILPGLFIFLIYTFIGNTLVNVQENEMTDVAIVNPTDTFETIYTSGETANESLENINVIVVTQTEVDEYKSLIDEEDWNVLIIFDENIESYDPLTQDNPEVTFYSNPKDMAVAVDRFRTYLLSYDEYLKSQEFGDITYIDFIFEQTEISDREMVGTIMSSLLPMLVIMFLFSGAMSIGPESIAGEKERNTISTLLITPIKRSELAIGKVLSLSVLSLISSMSSFIGIILSLPTLLNLGDQSLSVFTISDYLLILVVLFSTIFVIVGIVSVVSAYARSLKEATTYITPIYILTIIVSVSSMFSSGANTNVYVYLIPIYNAVQSLVGIMTFTDNIGLFVLVTTLANLTYLIGFILLLNRMFNSEQIMFKK